MSSADDVTMSENPVPETLETIAARIEALSKSTAERFATALAACDPALTSEEMEVAWEHFFAALN